MVKEYSPNELLTDTQVPFREHHAPSHAKKVISSGVTPIVDPDDNTRSLKPTAVTIGVAGTGGFDLQPNATYMYIATGDTNVLLASTTGVVPDAADLYIPAGKQMLISTGTQWRRLEAFSTPGASAQVIRVG